MFAADLSESTLDWTQLDGSTVANADLRRAVFEPKSLPEISSFASSENLELLTYADNPVALTELRKEFKDGGFRDQEREITYALKRTEEETNKEEAESLWINCRAGTAVGCAPWAIFWNYASYVVKTVLFDFTCRYGLKPVRPLELGFVLWFLCSFAYAGFIHGTGESGLYHIGSNTGAAGASADQTRQRIRPRLIRATAKLRRVLRLVHREADVLRTAMFFSAMSAFNIGFRDINFGRWLRLLTREEYDIKAVGWTRVIAGWQSLVSMYLIALWVLTYFGRPFE